MHHAIRTHPGEPPVADWTVLTIDDALGTLLGSGPPVQRPWVVAVDGRSGSGKSSLGRRLADRHPHGVVLSTDDVAWYESFFGWDQMLLDQVLGPARRRTAVSFRPPAWDARGRPGAIEVPVGTDLLIVEGVGASRRSLGAALDAAVWVASDREAARARGIARDGGDERAIRFWDEWQAEEVPFFAEDRPWERATLVVCGTPGAALADQPMHLVAVAGPIRR